MKVWRTILLYGLALAMITSVLKFMEYRFIVRDLSLEIYLGLIALMFTTLGVWAGLKLTRKKQIVTTPAKQFTRNEENLKRTGITKRELEVLELIGQGLSNQEIADRMFVSLNTVKTHIANLFTKLSARRRTQAIQRAKDLELIP
jgi:NarL family two-component system response regulator LiaR